MLHDNCLNIHTAEMRVDYQERSWTDYHCTRVLLYCRDCIETNGAHFSVTPTWLVCLWPIYVGKRNATTSTDVDFHPGISTKDQGPIFMTI